MKFVVVAFTLGLFLTVPGMILLRWIGLESVVQRMTLFFCAVLCRAMRGHRT
jgi:hypothetical protein